MPFLLTSHHWFHTTTTTPHKHTYTFFSWRWYFRRRLGHFRELVLLGLSLYTRYTCYWLLFVFLLAICLLLQRRCQSRTQKGEGKIIFAPLYRDVTKLTRQGSKTCRKDPLHTPRRINGNVRNYGSSPNFCIYTLASWQVTFSKINQHRLTLILLPDVETNRPSFKFQPDTRIGGWLNHNAAHLSCL